MDKHTHFAIKNVHSMTVHCRLVGLSVRKSVHRSVGRPTVRHWYPGARNFGQSSMLLRLLRASACFSVRLICIMKSNRNAFYVNSRKIVCDRQFIIEDADEKMNYFLATAS